MASSWSCKTSRAGKTIEVVNAVVTPPALNGTRSAHADWMELRAIYSSSGRSTAAEFLGVMDLIEDRIAAAHPRDEVTGEILDDAILETDRNPPVDAMFGELQYRQRVLGDAYPFAVNRRPLGLVRVDDSTSVPGRVVYLFCLLASAIRENKFQPTVVTRPAASRIANLFQVCACLAAGGYTAGEVVSFGFPRPTGTGFLRALRAAYDRFGAGTVRRGVPPGFPVSAKDEGIDVIAWRDHPDRMSGKLYLLGQSASGFDWEGKSVVDRVGQFHGWFTEPPARHWMPSMFIPFTLHRDLSDDPLVAFDEMLANRFIRQEARYGIVFDRLRIVYFANACLRTNGAVQARVDGRERFDDLEAWVRSTLEIPGLVGSG